MAQYRVAYRVLKNESTRLRGSSERDVVENKLDREPGDYFVVEVVDVETLKEPVVETDSSGNEQVVEDGVYEVVYDAVRSMSEFVDAENKEEAINQVGRPKDRPGGVVGNNEFVYEISDCREMSTELDESLNL